MHTQPQPRPSAPTPATDQPTHQADHHCARPPSPGPPTAADRHSATQSRGAATACASDRAPAQARHAQQYSADVASQTSLSRGAAPPSGGRPPRSPGRPDSHSTHAQALTDKVLPMHDWLRTVDIDPATPGVHAAAGHADGRSSDRAHATRTGHESTKPNEDGDGTCRGKAREVVLVSASTSGHARCARSMRISLARPRCWVSAG